MKRDKVHKGKDGGKGSFEARLYSVFEDVFSVPRSKLNPDIRRNDVEDWDSLGHVRLITAVEEEFSIRIPIDSAVRFKDIKSMLVYLLRIVKK